MPATPDLHVHGHVPVAGTAGAELRFSRRGDRVEVELHGVPHADRTEAVHDAELVADLAGAVRELATRPDLADATVTLAASHPADAVAPLPEAVAHAAGLVHHRDLLELRRPLPVPAAHPARPRAPQIATRPFDPRPEAGDRHAWIRSNNRAFAHHPDQGAETEATLAARLAESWFDPAGFLVVDDPERPGELAGSCWTKVHPAGPDAGQPALGEIYVIGVDPTQQGTGLGTALVLAGLDHLAGLGLATAVLFVEADNGPALALYDRLGFATHARRRVYTA